MGFLLCIAIFCHKGFSPSIPLGFSSLTLYHRKTEVLCRKFVLSRGFKWPSFDSVGILQLMFVWLVGIYISTGIICDHTMSEGIGEMQVVVPNPLFKELIYFATCLIHPSTFLCKVSYQTSFCIVCWNLSSCCKLSFRIIVWELSNGITFFCSLSRYDLRLSYQTLFVNCCIGSLLCCQTLSFWHMSHWMTFCTTTRHCAQNARGWCSRQTNDVMFQPENSSLIANLCMCTFHLHQIYFEWTTTTLCAQGWSWRQRNSWAQRRQPFCLHSRHPASPTSILSRSPTLDLNKNTKRIRKTVIGPFHCYSKNVPILRSYI